MYSVCFIFSYALVYMHNECGQGLSRRRRPLVTNSRREKCLSDALEQVTARYGNDGRGGPMELTNVECTAPRSSHIDGSSVPSCHGTQKATIASSLLKASAKSWPSIT